MRRNYSRVVWGTAFIIIGAMMLLDRLNVIYFDFGDFIHQWWPLILIIVGIGIIVDDKSCCGKRADADEAK